MVPLVRSPLFSFSTHVSRISVARCFSSSSIPVRPFVSCIPFFFFFFSFSFSFRFASECIPTVEVCERETVCVCVFVCLFRFCAIAHRHTHRHGSHCVVWGLISCSFSMLLLLLWGSIWALSYDVGCGSDRMSRFSSMVSFVLRKRRNGFM